jgi:arylsulfatase A-like enzyme
LAHAPEGEYLTDRLSDEAVRFIRESADTPWCLYLTHFAVHTPLDAKRELVAKYRAKPPGKLHSHVGMATMIQAVDDGFGRIEAVLEELNLVDRTVVILYSDNGGYGPATDMHPLKGYKGTYYEGGIRVPLVVRWPGVVESGSRCSVPVSGVDFYPTFCELAGIELSEDVALDGESLLPLLRGTPERFPQRALYWHFPAYLQSYRVWDEQRDPLFRSRPCGIIRRGNWKMHLYFEQNEVELYDLANDMGEQENLAQQRPQVAARLLNELKAWQDRVDAPVPTRPNPEFDAAAERAAIAQKRSSGGR